jgi:kynurenine formamidase
MADQLTGRADATSPWGEDDEIGRLNLMTSRTRREAMEGTDAGTAFDLGVEFSLDMPCWVEAGDPPFSIWMTHTPTGNIVDNPLDLPRDQNERIGYSGDAMSMYLHTGTHFDTLNHYAIDGKIWNGFSVHDHLGSRHWTRCGAENFPPIVARGVLLDVARTLDVEMLPHGYGITVEDIRATMEAQRVELRTGDVVLIRTGRIGAWPDVEETLDDSPGITLESAQFLVERCGAMVLGADNAAVEKYPSDDPDNWVPVHSYCLQGNGVPLLEAVTCEELSAAEVYEFCFIASPLKIRGATGTPARPIALPYR